MKTTFTLLLMLCVCATGFSQTTIGAKAFLDFEDDVVIPADVSGITVVDGTADLYTKVDGAFVQGVAAVPNALIVDGDDNMYFMDYDGYMKFDPTILNSSNFSLAMDYKWSQNNVWYTGILSIVGYNPDPESAGWVSKQLLFKNSANGQISAFDMGNITTELTMDTKNHVVLTFAEGIFTLYVNGVSVGTSANVVPINTYTDVSLYLGTKLIVDATSGAVSPQLDGTGKCKNNKNYIDNVALFDFPLTGEQVTSIFDGSAGVTTGIGDEANVSNVEIYPNPVSDVLFVSSDETTSVEIYNIAGVKVVSTIDVNSGIDLTNLSNGVFVVKCINIEGAVISTQKIIKK